MWKGWEDSEQNPVLLPKLELKEQCSLNPGIKSDAAEDHQSSINYRRSNGFTELANQAQGVFLNEHDTHSTSRTSHMREN